MSDRSKIGKWLEVQHGKIRKWASGMSHKLDPADVDDIVQTVSLELLEKDGKIDEPEAFARTLTPYRVYDVLRQRVRAPQSLQSMDEIGEHSTDLDRPINRFQKPNSAKEQCVDLWRAVGQLPKPQKAILVQRLVEGNTFAFIAAQNKLPESTARHYYAQAVEQLGRILKCVCLSGTVTDGDAKSLSSAEITARGVKMAEYRRTLTDEHGQFSMVLLQKGQYSLRSKKTGYKDDLRYLELKKDVQLPAIVLARADQTVEALEGSSLND